MITRHLNSNQKTWMAFRTSFGSRGKVKGRVEYVCPYCKRRAEPDFLERTQECGMDQLHCNLQSSSLNTLYLMMKPTWKEQLFISSFIFMELPMWPIGPIMCAQTKPLEGSAWGSRRESIKCDIMMNYVRRADWFIHFRAFCLAVLAVRLDHQRFCNEPKWQAWNAIAAKIKRKAVNQSTINPPWLLNF